MQNNWFVIFSLFNSHFPDGPRLVGTRMSLFWSLFELRMMEVVVTTGAVRCAKLQTSCQHQQINTQVFTGWMPFRSPNRQCQSTEGNLFASLHHTDMQYYWSVACINWVSRKKWIWEIRHWSCGHANG